MYVGQTSRSLRTRLLQHVALARRGSNTRKNEWLRELDASGLLPDSDVLEQGAWAQDACNVREAYWISSFRALNGDLLNVHAKGAGRIGSKFTDARKAAQSKTISAYLADPAARQQRSEAMVAKYRLNPELRQSDTKAMRKYLKDPKNRAIRTALLKGMYDKEPWRREELSKIAKARWADPEYKARKTLQSPEYRARRSAIAKDIANRPDQKRRLYEQGKAVSSRRVECLDCGKQGKLPSFGWHLKKMKHSGYKYLSTDGGGE